MVILFPTHAFQPGQAMPWRCYVCGYELLDHDSKVAKRNSEVMAKAGIPSFPAGKPIANLTLIGHYDEGNTSFVADGTLHLGPRAKYDRFMEYFKTGAPWPEIRRREHAIAESQQRNNKEDEVTVKKKFYVGKPALGAGWAKDTMEEALEHATELCQQSGEDQYVVQVIRKVSVQKPAVKIEVVR